MVSLGLEFLREEQTTLLSSLLYKVGEIGQTKTFNGYLSDFVQHTSYPHMQVGVSDFKITDTSNLLTSAVRELGLDGESESVKGRITDIERLGLSFKFAADTDFTVISGQVKALLSNVSIEYEVKPTSDSQSNSFNDQGKLGFQITHFNITAEQVEQEITGTKVPEVTEAFKLFLEALFSEDHAFSERELMLLERLIDYDVIDYSTYMKLYDDTIEVDY